MEGSCRHGKHGDEPSSSLKLLGNSWVAAQLAASQEGLSSVSKSLACTASIFLRKLMFRDVSKVLEWCCMEGARLSEMLVFIYLSTRHQIPERRNINVECCFVNFTQIVLIIFLCYIYQRQHCRCERRSLSIWGICCNIRKLIYLRIPLGFPGSRVLNLDLRCCRSV
jgi:hypothetical protein